MTYVSSTIITELEIPDYCLKILIQGGRVNHARDTIDGFLPAMVAPKYWLFLIVIATQCERCE